MKLKSKITCQEGIPPGEHWDPRIAESNTPPAAHQLEPAINQLADLLNMCMGLPKKDVSRFIGSPLNYLKFYREFENSIAKYMSDPANRLFYLISHCDDEARQAIEH